MSERLVKFGGFLKALPGAARIYPWTPFAERYAEVLKDRLGARVTVEKFVIRIQVTFFEGMYNEDVRMAVYFPITAKKKWIVEVRPKTHFKDVALKVHEVRRAMSTKNLDEFTAALNRLFDYLDKRFLRIIYEYTVKPYKGGYRVHRFTGKKRIRGRKGRY